MLVDWHDEKSEWTLRERGFDFAHASRVFEGEVEVFADHRQNYGEDRFPAFGSIEGRMYAVVFVDREDVRWIISAFRSRAKELERWKRRDADGRQESGGSTAPEWMRRRMPTRAVT